MPLADQSVDKNDQFFRTKNAHLVSEEEEVVPRGAKDPHQKIVIVEKNRFLRHCLQYSVIHCAHDHAIGCGSVSELAQMLAQDRSATVVLSTLSLSDEEKDKELELLAKLDPRPHTMVLAKNDDLNNVLFALDSGATGYISMSVDFDIFVEALRFVTVGGTYVPAQCLFEDLKARMTRTERPTKGLFTNREIAVIRAIRQGKPNKVIAYELNMCESTVNVHVRHVMKKIHARNRTEVALKCVNLVSSGELDLGDKASPSAVTRLNIRRG